jgi:DNA repair protein RadC
LEGSSDLDVLAMLLDGARPRAAGLLARLGTLAAISNASVAKLCKQGGLDVRTARRLAAAVLLARRLCVPTAVGETIASAADIHRLYSPRLSAERREIFVALALDCRNRIAGDVLVAVGSLSSVDVVPREAFRALVAESAAAAIFVHNHPSGDPSPSESDEHLSRQLGAAGDLLGIPVLDHVVIAREGYSSAMYPGAPIRVGPAGPWTTEEVPQHPGR